MSPLLRVIIVVGTSAFLLALTVPNIWVSLNGFVLPVTVNAHYDVAAITPGSLPAQAGLRVGDHIEPKDLSPYDRLALFGQAAVLAGRPLAVVVDRLGPDHPIVMRGSPPHGVSGVAIVKRLASVVFIVVAATLLLLRPSPMLWGFWLYALGSAGGSPFILTRWGDAAFVSGLMFLWLVFYDILGPLGLIVFATRFPTESSRGFRPALQRLFPAIAILVCLVGLFHGATVAGIVLPSPLAYFGRITLSIVTALGIAALLAAYYELDAPQRQRIRWVVAGFALFYGAVMYRYFSVLLPGQGWPAAWTNAGWDSEVLFGFQIAIPLAVAYAILKHHVLDINFVVERGLVYGIVTSIAIAVLAIADLFLNKVLEHTRLALAAEVLAAIVIGFWLNGLHAAVDRFVDRLIFRKRYAAEQRLAQAAAGLPHAESYDTIAQMMVREPKEALGLTSAAFFRRHEGAFRCEQAMGSGALANLVLGKDDPLVIYLQGAREAVGLANIGWLPPEGGYRESDPVIAFPVFIRNDLAAFALYGGHRTGEAIDPDERRILKTLCNAAASALDHSAAAELRRQLAESEQRLRRFESSPA